MNVATAAATQLSASAKRVVAAAVSKARPLRPMQQVCRSPFPKSTARSSLFQQQQRFCSHSRHSTSTMSAGNRLLLPTNVKPLHYALTLHPDLDKYTYKGTVGIDLQVNKDSKTIKLNTLQLELSNIKLSTGEEAKSHSWDEDSETTTIEFEKGVSAGDKTTLSIDFTGELNDKMCGFYRSVHTGDDGKTHVVATTQMEPTDCRRAFPCFDEPALKATFGVSLISEKHMTALSNSSVKEEVAFDGGLKKTVFNTTPSMSTYLVAFIVGEMNYVESKDFRVPVRAYATPGLEARCQFSVDLAAKTLAFFEKEFDIEYPLPKMDMVAIHDFSAGAMENWGLVTYRVVDLLFDEKNDNAHTKQRVAEVVQHELAHQWFGNLVTMEWWEGLWLNEGFATWMSWYACNHFFPEWKVWEGYVTDTLQQSLKLDGLRSSHPIEVPIERADQVNQIFDSISYAKGSSVIKMISTWLGEETFIKGVSVYLKRHAYGNTTTDDLWKALAEVSGKDIVAVMGPWTKKIGYPVVSVKESGDQITAEQHRFLSSGDVKPEEDETIYPLNLAVKSKQGVEEVMMNEREKAFKVDPDFYKLNAQQTGIYRVAYPMDRVEKLSEAGSEGLLSAEDRIGLVSDMAALGSSGYQRTSAFLELISKWKHETEYNVWSEMLTHLNALRLAWKSQPKPVRDAMKKCLGDLTVEKSRELGTTFKESDGLLNQQLKSTLYSAAVGAEDKQAVDHALGLYKAFISGDEQTVDPNLRGTVLATGAKYATDPKVFDELVKVYKNPKSSADGNNAVRSLGRCEKLPEVRERALKAALDGTIRSQDIFYVLVGFNGDDEGSKMVWSWCKANWDTIVEKFPPTTGMLGHILEISANGLSTQEQLNEIDAFFKGKSTKGFDKSVALAKERVATKMAWLNRDAKDVEDWLKGKGYLN